MRKLIEKLPDNVKFKIELLRKDYNNPALDRDMARARIGGYCDGLRDGGLITERERMMLVVYALR